MRKHSYSLIHRGALVALGIAITLSACQSSDSRADSRMMTNSESNVDKDGGGRAIAAGVATSPVAAPEANADALASQSRARDDAPFCPQVEGGEILGRSEAGRIPLDAIGNCRVNAQELQLGVVCGVGVLQ